MSKGWNDRYEATQAKYRRYTRVSLLGSYICDNTQIHKHTNTHIISVHKITIKTNEFVRHIFSPDSYVFMHQINARAESASCECWALSGWCLFFAKPRVEKHTSSNITVVIITGWVVLAGYIWWVKYIADWTCLKNGSQCGKNV